MDGHRRFTPMKTNLFRTWTAMALIAIGLSVAVVVHQHEPRVYLGVNHAVILVREPFTSLTIWYRPLRAVYFKEQP